MTLSKLSPEEYVRAVLPETFNLWGGSREFERYVSDFRWNAESASKRRRRFTVGFKVDDAVAASCKLYDREFHWGSKRLRATGIGAVFTPPALRGRGYASAMIGALLDEEREAGSDLAFLYSDIHPAFYERLGFITLPSRIFSARATSFDGSPSGATPLAAADWPLVRRCFDDLEARRPWGFTRGPSYWAWLRRRWDAPSGAGEQTVQLGIRHDRRIIAYAVGARVPREDTFVVEDFAYIEEEGRSKLSTLLRAAAGDLRKISGWLPPEPARGVLPRGSVRARKTAILMVLALSSAARSWWQAEGTSIATARGDAGWSADHI